MRGLRVPGRLNPVDPMDLSMRADEMPREEILGKYARVMLVEELVEVYRQPVEGVGADHTSVQIASLDPDAVVDMVGRDVLPAPRAMVPAQP